MKTELSLALMFVVIISLFGYYFIIEGFYNEDRAFEANCKYENGQMIEADGMRFCSKIK